MSTAIDRRPLTTTQRTTQATQQAAELLGVDDLKRVGAAVAEAAVESMRGNPAFLTRVRGLYESMAVPKKVAAPKATKKTGIELVPIKQIDVEIDPAAPPDPYFLLELYGAKQLALALAPYTLPRLREAVRLVQTRHPGTKPSGTSKQHAIDYITRFVGG